MKLELINTWDTYFAYINLPNKAMTSPRGLCLAYALGLSELSQTSIGLSALQEMPVDQCILFGLYMAKNPTDCLPPPFGGSLRLKVSDGKGRHLFQAHCLSSFCRRGCETSTTSGWIIPLTEWCGSLPGVEKSMLLFLETFLLNRKEMNLELLVSCSSSEEKITRVFLYISTHTYRKHAIQEMANLSRCF